MTSAGFAQFSSTKLDQSFLKGVDSLNTNFEYLEEVQNNATPRQVKQLEKVVTLFDLAKFPQFESSQGTFFNVTFKSHLGHITALYDKQGKVLSATEQFKNFALPYAVGVAITKEYPQWEITKSIYKVKYTKGQEPKKNFKVQISNDNEVKWLHIGSEGIIS
jgi:hypothetical protein